MSPEATRIFLFVVIPLLLIIDFVLAVDRTEGNTYSEWFRKWFRSMNWLYYGIFFAVGVLMSHWGPK